VNWHAIEVTAEPEAVEAIESAFNQIDSLGTEVQQFHKKQNEPLVVVGYFESLPDEDVFEQQLESSLRLHDIGGDQIINIRQKTIEQTDWLAEWKRHWRPTRVGRFLIAPEWEVPSDESADTIVVRIEPNMAFGTGTHETTQLCLKAIDELFQPGMSFLDVGTGTGILAIAAAKLCEVEQADSAPIVGLDVDADAIAIARQNAQRNGVGDKIEFELGSLTGSTPSFDLVCANLTADVISPLLPLLLEKSRQIAVLSGILREQESAMMSALSKLNFQTPYVTRSGEWISITIRTR
jgi:ribosomal protein L11 methyltransferase